MVPVTLGLGLINFNAVIDTFFAARLIDPDLAPAAIDEAFRDLHAPARDVRRRGRDRALPDPLPARGSRRHRRASARPSRSGLRQIGFLLMPASVVGAVLAEPIVRLLYERGAFGPDQTTVVADALAAFSLGLTFNGTMLMLNRAFFSLQSPWIPTVVALGNLGLNVVLDVAFFRLGVWGIPLATSLVNIAGVALLLIPAPPDRPVDGRDDRRSFARTRRLDRAGGVAYGVWWVLDDALGRVVVGSDRLGRRCARRRRRRLPRRLPCPPGPRAGDATLAARPLPPRLITHGPRPHPQLLDHRPHRPRQVDAGGPDPQLTDGRRARDARAAARLDGPRARARDHDQGAGRARRTGRATSST